MPSKNLIKTYIEDGVYHIYNRGINKQDIFLDEKDYATFLFFLKLYLDNPDHLKELDPQKRLYLARRNFHSHVDLLCYCLMPNHFHLVIKQKSRYNIAEFMKCAMTNYSMYFNNRYERIGHLFQGRYKASLIKNDNYLLHLSRYIHMNPITNKINQEKPSEQPAKGQTLGRLFRDLLEYEYSSYSVYLGRKNIKWVQPELVLEYFDGHEKEDIMNRSSYQEFVEDYTIDSEQVLGDRVLE